MKYALEGCFREVELKDKYCVNALDKETAYLLSFDADRLLAGFRETAGIDTKGAKRYSGWENMLIGGHTMGHFLSAMAQAYANSGVSTGDKARIRRIITYIIDELLVCQDNSKGGKGFIFGATFVDDEGHRIEADRIKEENGINVEAQFDRVEKGRTNIITESWVPWYTMHKLFAGIIAVYELMGGGIPKDDTDAAAAPDEPAEKGQQGDDSLIADTLKLLKGLGDWVCNRSSKWSEETRRTVVSIEYGGMNDVLYELYAITGEERYCLAGDRFDEPELYKKVASGAKDVLNNHHANTTIPKFVGALNRFVRVHMKTVNGKLRDEREYFDYAVKFWDMVNERHTYITGGNSEWEHFGNDYVLNAERTACNNETCNVFNMLKLTRGLFMLTLDRKYADYYENTFYNSILSSQNPETGMTTYFQPMATGYFKTYGEPFTKFWCCTGSGMENFTKLGDSMFFHRGELLFVNMYFDSVLTLKDRDLKLSAESGLPCNGKVKITFETLSGRENTGNIRLFLRIPAWVDEPGEVSFTINKECCKPDPVVMEKLEECGMIPERTGEDRVDLSKGWALFEREFKNGDVLEFTLPMKLKAVGLPDDDKVFGLKYGPVVLSADLGCENMSTTITGVDVTVPARKIVESEAVILPGGVTREEFAEDPGKYAVDLRTAEDPAGADDAGKEIAGADDAQTDRCGADAADEQIPRFKICDFKPVFSPHYLRYRERYGIYFSYLTEEEAQKAMEEGRLGNEETVDTVMPGYGQYENDELHSMSENNTISVTSGATYRIAKAGGSFSYRMAVEKGRKNRISMMLRLCDNRKPLIISADGVVLCEGPLVWRGTDQYYRFELELPDEVIENAEHIVANDTEYDVIRVTFSGTSESDSAAVCDYIRTSVY